MNEWCADDDLVIIRFNNEINRIEKLPEYGDWIFGLGVDLGFNDATSFTVGRHVFQESASLPPKVF
jgi:hypothetical protein